VSGSAPTPGEASLQRRAVVITVSDGVAAGTRQDVSGEVLAARLDALGYAVERQRVPDEPDAIARRVTAATDGGADLVITTGGTGLGPRDRTPEAVRDVLEVVVPGFGEVMRAVARSCSACRAARVAPPNRWTPSLTSSSMPSAWPPAGPRTTDPQRRDPGAG
jgi:molybdenum cofactor synthesis domain-containing protein